MDAKKIAVALAAFAGGTAALTAAAVALGRRQSGGGNDGPAPARPQALGTVSEGAEGHAAPDLAPDAEPHQRAPEAFRPDMDAPMSAAEREALRPATGPGPTLVGASTSAPTG